MVTSYFRSVGLDERWKLTPSPSGGMLPFRTPVMHQFIHQAISIVLWFFFDSFHVVFIPNPAGLIPALLLTLQGYPVLNVNNITMSKSFSVNQVETLNLPHIFLYDIKHYQHYSNDDIFLLFSKKVKKIYVEIYNVYI